MKIPYIKEAPVLRAYLLISQEKNKKVFKSIQPEISKMSEIFGPEFDQNLHLILFNDIDFKDLKGLQKSKDRKIQYFLQDFPQFVEREDFVDIFSKILMKTKNTGTTTEIFNGLNKQYKLSMENQMKILLSFAMSDTERYQEEAKNIILEKCKDIFKDKKINNLTESTVYSLVILLEDIKQEESEKENGESEENSRKSQIEEYVNYFMNYEEELNSCQTSADDIKQISDLDKILDNGNEDPVEIEKLFEDLGPFIIGNKINISISEIISCEIDAERLGKFIVFMINHPTVKLNEELKELNKNFLESITKNSSQNVNSNINFDECQKLLEENLNKDISWDIDAIYKLFKKYIDNMDANQVLNSLDNEFFCIKDKKTFDFMIDILHKLNILKEYNENYKDKFFKNLVFTKWNNEINQIEFIDFMINNEDVNENSYYSLNNYNGCRISEEIDNKILQKYNENSNVKNQYLVNNWKILDLIEILLQLAKGDFNNSVKEIFKWPIQNIPEIFSLVLVSITPDADSFLYQELAYEVIPKILDIKNQNKDLVDEIWNLNKNLVISIVSKMWDSQQEMSNLGNLFEIINVKLPKALPQFVNSKYYNFSVNLAIYAAKREKLNLKQWLEERIIKVEDEFIEAILDYIKKNLISQCTGNSNNSLLEKAQLTSESLAIILESVIKSCETNKLSQKTKKYSIEIYKNIFDLFEELQIQSINIEEIDKEVHQILTSMYKGDISVDNVITKLISYNNSPNQKENEKYAFILHCVFNELQFYYQYPEKELKKAAELFGKIINNNVIEGMLLTIVLKFILEGIKKGQGAMYTFGTIALNQFIGKISQWPNFMNSLIDVSQLKNEKDLYQKLLKQFNESKKKEKGINSENSHGEEGESILESGDKNNDAATGREFSIDKDDNNMSKQYDKLKNKLNGPAISFDGISKNNRNENQNQVSEEIITKIKFIFGAPNKLNIQDKIKDLKSLFKEDKIIKWFAQYFVNSLINTENIPFYQKYYEVFDQLKNKELHKEIIKATINKVFKFTTNNSDPISSESVKETLKNLGMWLGEYKISKDRPILAKDLDFKTLIIEACEKGKLHLVIPFICCVFKYAVNSKVFKFTNPWISSILNLLSELNSNPAVEPGLKEEIKSLFKTLQADINIWPKTKELEKCHIKTNSSFYVREINKEFFYKKISELDDYINNLLGTFNSDPNLFSRTFSRKSNSNNNTNNENNFYSQNDVIKLLSEVMNNCIQEIIPDIVDKNIKTSIGTSISLVNKDFMFEKDESKYISALESTMKMLALSLLTTNGKELLKKNIDEGFTKVLSTKNLSKKTIEKIKQQPNPEFLSIGLDYIQNFINNEALKILHENPLVKEVLEKRRQNNINNKVSNNAINNNNIFLDNKHLCEYKKIIKILPDKLQPNENCISDEELKIYDKFSKLYEIMNSREDIGKNSFLNTVYRILKEVLDNMGAGKAGFRDYGICMTNIQNVSQKNDMNYDEDDQQLVCLEKIISESKIDKNLEIQLAETTLDYAINGIKNGNMLLLNVYSYILKGWASLNNKVSEVITKKLLEHEDIFIRYKFELYHNFIKKKIIDNEKLEKHFIDILNKNGSDLLARNLLKKIITKAKNYHSYYYDNNSNIYYSLFGNKSQISSYFLDINTSPILNLKHKNEQNTYRNLSSLLLDQVNKYLKNEDNPNIISEMRKKNSLKIDNLSENSLFILILFICEICIKGPLENQKNTLTLCFPNNAALIIYIIFYVKEKIDKLKIFQKVIMGIGNFFHKDYIKSEKNLNQRIYFRLLYNLLYLLNKNQNDENILDSEYKKISYIYKIVDLLKFLSPAYYPIFAIGWLELISCNIFISNFLELPMHPLPSKKKDKNEKYEKYLSLLVELLNYIDSLNSKIISDYNYVIYIEKLYKFFFLLSNSYPEFVSNYYYQLITCLSSETNNFIQLKNIILSATPKNIFIPDIELGISNSEEDDKTEDSNSPGDNNSINSNNNNLYSTIKKPATILFDTGLFLDKKEIKPLIDKYIIEENENYLVNLVKLLGNVEDEKEENQIFNSIIIYWSQSKHKYYLNEKSIKSKEIIFKFYLYLTNKLNENQRNLLINAILNSLRFPCIQTMSYSLLLQELFLEIKNDEIKEHILNNLLERLLYKPLPWGIRYTMVNLYKKDKFQKIIKPFIEKYKLNDVLQKLVKNCKENNLKNYVLDKINSS